MKRKILSILIILAMLFPFGIVANSVKATDAVNEVVVKQSTEPKAENEYDNLSSAIKALENKEGIIRLEKDITEETDTDNEIKFSTGKITLDLNGHTITDNNNHKNDLIAVEKGAQLNIVNNVKTEGKITVKDASAAAICNKGEVTISGNVTISYAGEGDAYYMVENFGDMTIGEGVTISSTKHKSSLIVNGISEHTHKGEAPTEEQFDGANLTINGGTFKGGKYVIKNDQKGVLTINDGIFENNLKKDGVTDKNSSAGTNNYYAIILNSSEAIIKKGSFNAQGNSTKATSVDIIQRPGEDGKGNNYGNGYEGPRLTIDGGNFISGCSEIIYKSTDSLSGDVTNVTDVNGGTFSAEIKKYLDEKDVEVYITNPKNGVLEKKQLMNQ